MSSAAGRGRGPSTSPRSARCSTTAVEDELYVDYGQRPGDCRAADGDVLVSVLEPVEEAAWAVTRPLFTLPLLES